MQILCCGRGRVRGGAGGGLPSGRGEGRQRGHGAGTLRPVGLDCPTPQAVPLLARPYPKQEAVGAGELVIPDGLVHDQDTAQQRHGKGDHPRRGQLRGGQKDKDAVAGVVKPGEGQGSVRGSLAPGGRGASSSKPARKGEGAAFTDGKQAP